MNVYSKEREILDRNTVLYMIDEMQEEIERKDLELAQKDHALLRQQQEILELKSRLAALQEAEN